MSVSRERLIAVGLLCAGIVLCVFASLRLIDGISSARIDGLASAQQTVSQTLAPALTSRQSQRIRQATTTLVSAADNPISYLTVRDSQGRLLASAGSHAGVFGWLPSNAALSWRAWFYRSFSAEDVVALAGAQVGLGVSWAAILLDSVASWALWVLLCLVGVGLVVRAVTPRPRTAATAGQPAAARASAQPAPEQGAAAWVGKRRHRKQPAQPMTASASPDKASGRLQPVLARLAALPSAVGARKKVGSKQPKPAAAGGFEVIGSRGKVAAKTAPEPPALQTEHAPTVSVSKPYLQPSAAEQRDTPAPAAATALARSSAGATTHQSPGQSATQLAATSSPAFGERTLDLRFRPIWRGTQRSQLAGGWATLSWRSGDGEPVDPATLAELAEQEGALRAFAQWIAERLAMLQANWRTLELPTVPIVLPVPPSLFAVPGSRHIWESALERVGQGGSDLVLQIDPSEGGAGLALRQARAATIDPTGHCTDVGAGNMVFIQPAENDHCEAAQRALNATTYPMLVGPLLNPLAQTELLVHEQRVAWFSDADNEDNLYTPRGFARLMSQQALAPL